MEASTQESEEGLESQARVTERAMKEARSTVETPESQRCQEEGREHVSYNQQGHRGGAAQALWNSHLISH